MNPLQKLKNKVFNKEKESSPLETVFGLIYELKCLPQVIGEEFEVYDREGKLVYVVKRKPMRANQLNTLLESLDTHLKKINEEVKGKGPKKNFRRPRKR